MKKILFLATAVIMLFAVACQKEEPSTVESLSFTESEYAVTLYDTLNVQEYVRIFPANIASSAKVQFQSSDESVATINDKGQLIALCEGETFISVSANGKEAKCKVFVRPFSAIANFQETVNGVSFTMIAVEGGTFQMGSTPEEEHEGHYPGVEEPAHNVSLSSYYLSSTEVTQALYQAVIGENPSVRKGDNLPVESISWYDAQAFCEKLSQLTGKKYVLPTEAQWEYAARGGKYHEGTKYAGSNNADEVAWTEENSNETHPVATKAPNALGLYDMSGNVYEWCSDWWDYYSAEDQTNPTGAETGEFRAIRGGGWNSTEGYSRVCDRGLEEPFRHFYYYGFRVAMIP